MAEGPTGRVAVVLVDTSVWIEVLRKPAGLNLQDLLDFELLADVSPLESRRVTPRR